LIRGDQFSSYEIGSDKSVSQDGKNSATIKSVKDTIDGFGTLMQTCMPDKFIGKRVKMTSYIKKENVKGSAGLWLRVDCDTNTVSFDNMHDGKTDRSIKGTTKWTRYEIVLNVPANSTLLSYGALLSGTGQIWFDNFAFELVENSVETTGIETPSDIQQPRKKSGVLSEPYNLSFEI
jgi:hypothetical protein